MKVKEPNNYMEFIRSSILIDVTMFAHHPTRTGIQRMLQAFIGQRENFKIIPFVIADDGNIGILSIEYFNKCLNFFNKELGKLSELTQLMHGSNSLKDEHYLLLKDAAKPIVLIDAVQAFEAASAILYWDYNFYPHTQQLYFDNIARFGHKIFYVVIDFLFWTHFEYFSKESIESYHHTRYLMLLRRIRNLIFISNETRDEFYKRIGREWVGNEIVAIPGGDALGKDIKQNVSKKANFLVVGTVEPRKRSMEIMTVFNKLIDAGHDIYLTFLGGLSPLLHDSDRKKFEQLSSNDGRIKWIDYPSDETIRINFQNARALIYISACEGYGAPPIEALSLGIPCITSDNLPSTRAVGYKGQVVIPFNDSSALEDAIISFASVKFTKAKQNEIKELKLPTWYDFASSIMGWMSESTHKNDIYNFYKEYFIYEFGYDKFVDKKNQFDLPEDFKFVELLNLKKFFQDNKDKIEKTPLRNAINKLELKLNPKKLLKNLSFQEIEAELNNRFEFHSQILVHDIEEFADIISSLYLERSLSWAEREIHKLIPGLTCLKISVLYAFVACDEAKLKDDPIREQWLQFIKEWERYQIVMPSCQEPSDYLFIKQCYESILCRSPDNEGIKNYLNTLWDDPENGRLRVLKSMLSSKEHIDSVKNFRVYAWALNKLDFNLF